MKSYPRAIRATGLAAAIAMALSASPTIADDSSTLAVSANVPIFCAIDSVSAMAFGDVNFAGVKDQTATIQWRCTKDSNTTIELDAGDNGTVDARSMAGPGSALLPYQLSTDPGYGDTWGDGTAGTVVANVTGAGLGVAASTTTIHGRIDSTNFPIDLESGSYSDSVLVTIKF